MLARTTIAAGLFAVVLGASAGTPSVAANDRGYDWNLPPGFPLPRVPADNPMSAAKVELGRFLFYDERLSATGAYSCASCHRQERAFTDGRARAVGATGQQHRRSAMSLANVAYNASYTWSDPDVRRLEEQALVPMFNEHPVELGWSGREQAVLERLRDDTDYREMFREAFSGDAEPLTTANVSRALAAFERTLISGGSPYNRLVYHDERDALSPAARRGMRLFFSERTRCADCHAGFTFSGPVVFDELEDEIEPAFHNTGLYNLDATGAYPGDQGLRESTGDPRHGGEFRAPTLLNIELTAPYMHDGSVATLEEVVELYAAGGRVVRDGPHAGDGRANPNKSDRVSGFELSARDKTDLVEFLKSLTDRSFVADPRFGNPFEPREAVRGHEPESAQSQSNSAGQSR